MTPQKRENAPRFRKRAWKNDPRSKKFSNHKFFGTLALSQIPETLGRTLGTVFDQKFTLRCTGYGNAAEGFYIAGIVAHPDWAAAKIGQKQGQSVDVNGGDPNAAMRSMRDDGFLERSLSPISLQTNGAAGSGMNSFPSSLDAKATKLVPGFVKVDGPHDLFDDARSMLTQNYDPVTGRGPGIDAFGTWYEEWSFAEGGIIPQTYSRFAGYHRYVIADFKKINGIMYLVIHNSYGEGLGNGGFFYMTREVFNREFAKSGTTLKMAHMLTQSQYDEAKKETPWGRLWRAIIDAWYGISEIVVRLGLRSA